MPQRAEAAKKSKTPKSLSVPAGSPGAATGANGTTSETSQRGLRFSRTREGTTRLPTAVSPRHSLRAALNDRYDHNMRACCSVVRDASLLRQC